MQLIICTFYGNFQFFPPFQAAPAEYIRCVLRSGFAWSSQATKLIKPHLHGPFHQQIRQPQRIALYLWNIVTFWRNHFCSGITKINKYFIIISTIVRESNFSILDEFSSFSLLLECKFRPEAVWLIDTLSLDFNLWWRSYNSVIKKGRYFKIIIRF